MDAVRMFQIISEALDAGDLARADRLLWRLQHSLLVKRNVRNYCLQSEDALRRRLAFAILNTDENPHGETVRRQ